MSWDELVAAALIGTDRRPVGAGAPPGSPPELAAALEHAGRRGPAARRRGGLDRRPPRGRAAAGAGRRASPSPRTRGRMCSPAAAARLAALLEEDEFLVPEWLVRADERGLRVPPELVPDAAGVLHDADVPRWTRVVAAAGPLGGLARRAQPGLERGPHVHRRPGGGLGRGRPLGAPPAARGAPAPGRSRRGAGAARVHVRRRDVGGPRAAAPRARGGALRRRRAVPRGGARRPPQARPRRRRRACSRGSRTRARRSGSRSACSRCSTSQDGRIVVTLPAAESNRAALLTDLLAAAPLKIWDLSHGHAARRRRPRARGPRGLGARRPPAGQPGVGAGARGARRPPARRAGGDRGDAVRTSSSSPRGCRTGTGASRSRARSSTAIRREPEVDARFAGYCLHPAVEPEVETLRELGGRHMWRLCERVATRAAMLRELG